MQKRMFKKFYPVLIIIIFLAAAPLTANTIRIGIIENADSVNVSCEGEFSVVDTGSGREMKLNSRNVYLVSARGRNIKIREKTLGSKIKIKPAGAKDRLRVNGKRYRGVITIVSSGKLRVINTLGLEEYLYGVLPREISPEWPVEAMKTQAVVSRTFAVRNKGKHGSKGYDLSATVFCQVYGGMECEDKRSNAAVDSTKGEVIKCGDELVQAVSHSTCGGFTEEVSNVWKNDDPPKYLKCVRCQYCRKSPRYSWEKTIKKEVIRTRLNNKGYKVGQIKQLKVAGRAPFSKRAMYINVYHSGGKLAIQSNRFRLAVGADVIKSALLRLKNYRDEVKFVGRGWGHGVGLCQWGAKGCAERGHGYRKIIRKYYPGTKVVKALND